MGKYKFTVFFTGWMVFITSSSLFSFSSEGEDRIWFPHLDKIVHVIFHFGILVLGAHAIYEIGPKKWNWGKRITSLLLFSVSYGLVIELLQWIMPFDRSAEFWDVLANLTGALGGVLLIQKYRSLIEGLK
ncbi:MAG: VanZ family protein [Bacteroidota bacterium]